jgi:methionyl-tRNA synthetase
LDEKPQPPAASEPPQANPPPAPPEPNRISIDRFFETELRVAQILSAERVENTDKLLKLQVDLGTEKRQLVAGLAASYEPEALVGRRIIVVANLKPARIRGVESQGMLLAADLGGRPLLATFDEEVPPGTRVR